MIRLLLFIFSLVAGVLLAAVSPLEALARQAGKQEFLQAHEHYADKDYGSALPLFRRALVLSRSPNARLYVARCLRELGKLDEAYDEMYATVRDATTRAETESKYVATRDAAASELALLDRRVGKLVIALEDPPAGSEVKLGARVVSDRLGAPVAVMPGPVVVEARAPERAVLRRHLAVGAGETKAISLRFGPPVSSTLQQAAPGPAEDEATDQAAGGASDLGAVRIAGIVVTGVGAAALVVFGVTGAVAKSKYDEADEGCGGTRCTDPKYDQVIDDGKTMALIANVTLVVGAAAIVAGAAMIVFGGPGESDTPAASRPAVSVAVTPEGGTLVVRGRF